ncbi:MAG: Helix-turn-helix domain/PilZ domain, partial [Porphyrobacter sp. HL-46]
TASGCSPPRRPASAAPPAPSPGAGETLGARLGRLRREAGLTLAEVAARLGVSKPTVWAWEKGKARPLPERTEAIAEALGVAPDQIATAAGSSADLGAVVEDCRSRIADACGAAPAAVRIMIEL